MITGSKSSPTRLPAYPLRLSANHRYLVDRNNKPFLIVGDTPQDLMSRLTEKEADRYFADRVAHGFNTMGWIDVICAGPDSPDNKDSRTIDGILPFTGYVRGGTDYEHYDLSRPNEAYFTRLDHIVGMAEKHGILVFLDPMDPLFDLSGRVALVTGTSRGLGQYFARALASAGADIAMTSRNSKHSRLLPMRFEH